MKARPHRTDPHDATSGSAPTNRRDLFTTVVISLFVAGCGDGISPLPDPVPGADRTLVLVEVNGQNLPVTVDEGPNQRVYLADTIRTFEDDTWTRIQHTRFFPAGDTPQTLLLETEGSIRLDEGALVLDFVCNDNPEAPAAQLSCLPPDRLVEVEDGWRVGNEFTPGAPMFLFQEIAGG